MYASIYICILNQFFERRVGEHSSLKRRGRKTKKVKHIYQKVKEDDTTIYIFMYTYVCPFMCMYVSFSIYILNHRCWATRPWAQLPKKMKKESKEK